MTGNIIESSVLPDIGNAGLAVGRAIGEGGGWLRNQFNQTSPDTQKWLLAAVGLIGGAIAGNVVANVSGQQGHWGGTAIKWGLAIAAMTVLSSDQGRNVLSSLLGIGGDPNRDTTANLDTATPTREVRPALPSPG